MRPASFSKQLLCVILIANMMMLPLMGAAPGGAARGAAPAHWTVPSADFSFAPPEPLASPQPPSAPKAASPAPSAAGPAAPSGPHAAVARAISRLRPAAMMMQASSISVSVAYADSSSATASFPTPWQGSPNVVFIGAGAALNAGAIRIDNPGPTPLTIDNVAVDLQRPTAQFNLWGSFTIPAGGSAILTQTQPGNFDTSAFPIVACGGTLAANETRIPNITVTIGGTPQTFVDSAHVLDTGGFDLSCRGNESLQWRQAGTTGIVNLSGHLSLSPATSTGTGGSPLTTTAQLTDASGSPLANVTVDFDVLTGPNAGQTGQGVTDSNGNATFTYTSSTQGADVVQASVTNASQGEVASNQVTVNWQTASCGATGTQSGTASLTYIGTAEGEFNDSAELAALLTDSTGTPASGRTVTFTLGAQNFSAVTDSTGVARAATVLSSAPGQVPVNATFAGDATLPALQGSGTITVDRDETQIRYTGTTLLGNSAPQPVTAVLLDPESLAPVANETVTFTVNNVTATATTNANGVAATTISLGTTQPTGPSQLTVKFAGDQFYKPSVRTIPVTIFFPAGFVVWGGNNGGLKIGQQVNFWGSQWEQQVINGQYFAANPSFKGWSGSLAPIQPCEVNATPSTLDMNCWQVKPGQSFPPSETLPNFIEVVVSTVIVKSSSTVFGNIACGAIVQVNHTPPYGGVPGQPGFGTIAAVDGSCAGVFPPPAVITATQTQPATVLPNQQITISTTVNNTSTATAATSVTVNETLDGLTPGTATLNLGTVQPNGNQSGTFQATVPGIPARQSSESSTDYIQRLSALDGRIFTASGLVTFTDATQQNYLPVNVSSQSVLKIPILNLALTGPAVVTPGSPATYFVTATNIGSAAASSVTINVTLPDGSTASFPVSAIVPGSSFSQPVNFTPAALAPKGTNETTDQYLARLAAADGQILTISSTANWADANGNAYGDVGQQMFSSRVRVPILSFSGQAPATLLPSQNATLNFNVNNSGGCTAVLSTLQVTNPDNSTVSAPQFPLAAGQSTTAQTTWKVTTVPARSPSETDAAYQTRLAATNNSTLNFLANLSWSDPEGGNYGPTSEPVQSKEVLPIVTVALAAPSTATAGTAIGYTVTLTNVGGATSPGITLTLTLPDGSMQTPVAGPLAPGGVFQATVNFSIPATQAAGVITATASVLWNDAQQNAYGPLSSSAQTTVTNPQQFNSLVLAPAISGPDVTGTTQTLTATLKDSSGNPVVNATVQFNVTGANPGSGSAITNAAGVATFSYSGAHSGNDAVVATSGTAVSNTATVGWITPVQNVSTSTIFARFFTSDGSGAFDTPPTATPAFTQTFPTINFNPPAGTVPGNTSGIGVNTRPFFDVTTDLNGNFTGTIEAQGNGQAAGVNNLFTFQAVFTGAFTIASAGDVVFPFFSDDGFILGVGGGATRVSGPLVNVPASGVTPFEKLPVVGAFNVATAPTANTIVVHFPAAGSYPYELDYTECCGGQESLTMTVGQANSKGVPPTGSLVISPNNPPTLAAGQTQTFSVQAFDASGAAVQNLGVALIINGANMQQLSATTDATGKATFSYKAVNAGTDTLQAVGNISGLGAISNLVTVNWSVPSGGGGGGGGTTVFAQQGWIGAPLIGTVLQGQLPITVAPGITLTSGTLEYWPTANPSDIHVINGNTTGSGTIGTFDGTTLASGGYTIQLQATASNGTTQTSVIVVSVIGDNKPGRVNATAVDLTVPVAGLPIRITRTYDSLKRDTVQDFGFGWSLATSVDLQTDAANNVTFTINGKRRTFFFSPQPSSFLFPWLLIPKYVPQAGLHGSLTSDGCGALLLVQGNQVCFPFGPYQPTVYAYTDPLGRVFTIAANGQIQSIKDLNGNTLTFGANGITSSTGGISVPFVRDNQGRITQITDLQGNNYNYSYDSAGNLSSLALPNTQNPVTYTYSSDHLLLSETDPRGNPSSAAYFPDGRLQSTTDSLGNVTQYSYNLTTNTVTTTNPDGGTIVQTNNSFGNPVSITDPLGHTTTFTYDNNQNLLTQTDPLGHVTTYTYDANGFRTSVKNPLGNIFSKVYSPFGAITSATDPLGNTITVTYDDASNPTQVSDSLGQINAGTFDADGRLLTMTDANGKTMQFAYDARGNLITKTDQLNGVTQFTYDAMDRVTSETDPRGSVTQFAYDGLSRLASKTDANNNITKFGYDDSGNRTSVTDPLGRTTNYTYDALDRVTKISYPDGTARQYTYDFRGNVLADTDRAGHVTQYQYDKAGQMLSATFANGTGDAGTVKYAYDVAGHRVSVTDERNNVTTYAYDAAGRLTSVKDALNHTASYGYDAGSRKTSITDANNHATSYTFDARSRITAVTYPDNTVTKYTYDGLGNTLTTTDQAGNVTTRTYDDFSRMISMTNAMGQTVKYGYDADSNLLSLTDPAGRITSFQYDNLGHRTKRVLPLGMSETTTYDAAGNLTGRTDFNGLTATYTYDAMNRLLQKVPDPSLNQPTIAFAYTPTGKRGSMADASGTTTYTYDNRDRLIKKVTPEGVLTYTYDAASNPLTIVSSNGGGASISYSYDALNRLATATDNRLIAQGASSAVTTYSYDPAGNVASYTYPNAVQVSEVYDALNRTTQISGSHNGLLSSFSYKFGPAGNRTNVTELAGRTVNYGFDPTYRLTSEAITGDPAGRNGTVNYTYDAVGNRTQMNSTLAAIPPGVFSYDANDRLTTDSYDNNGNTISSASIANSYDFENRLLHHGAVSIVYDGDGNRVSETAGSVTTKYLVDDVNPTGYPQVMDELINGSVARTYAYGLARVSEDQLISGTPAASFYGYDGHGNVRYLTSAAGTVTDTYQLDAFGNTIATTGTTPNNFLFGGEPSDSALNLYYLRARYYNQLTGRFITADPLAGDTRITLQPFTQHLYLYAGDDPVDLLDPTGTQAILEYKLLRKLVAGMGLQVHHLIEKRFAQTLGLVACEMLSIALTPEEHQIYTNAWRAAIPYGPNGTGCATAAEIYAAAMEIYADKEFILLALGLLSD